MILIGIDPGNTHTAYAVIDDGQIIEAHYVPNQELITWLYACNAGEKYRGAQFWCEMIASYGMPVGASVFETCLMIGRILAVRPSAFLVTRNEVKNRVCGSSKAKDANIRQALIDAYGPPGKAKAPGPTYGISGDQWAALAVAHAASLGATPYVLSHLRQKAAA